MIFGNIVKQFEQQEAFKIARVSGYMRDLAISRGGTGELRYPLSHKEKQRRMKRRQIAKTSRRANR